MGSARTAADKMDNLQAVAFRKVGFAPLFTWDNRAIQFDSDTVLLHSELLKQSGKRKREVEAASFPVDHELHFGG